VGVLHLGAKKKGSLEETLSLALYGDDPHLFMLTYRDKDLFKEASLDDFMNRDDLGDIPITRIVTVARNGKVVWRKGQKEVSLKSNKQKPGRTLGIN
jgi:hypothetical protein